MMDRECLTKEIINYQIGTPKKDVAKAGHIKNFPRKSKNAWYLLGEVLKDSGYVKVKEDN